MAQDKAQYWDTDPTVAPGAGADTVDGGKAPSLVGLRIVAVRPMTKRELKQYGWDLGYMAPGTVIELQGGLKLIVSGDEEGNHPGSLFMQDDKGNEYYVA